MTLTPWHLNDVANLLREAGVLVVEGAHYFDLPCDQALISVEARPGYCNRGRYLVKAWSNDQALLTIDEHDGFPRYYFGAEACASELLAWMAARGLLPKRTTAGEEGEMVRCPGCTLELSERDTRGQIAHMEAAHPDIIRERQLAAGLPQKEFR